MFIKWQFYLTFLTGVFLFSMSSAVGANSASSVIATIKGENIRYGEVDIGSKIEIHEAEMKLYNIRMRKLKQILIPKLIKLDPRSKNLKENDYISTHIIKPIAISEEDVLQFSKKQRIPADKLDNELKAKIRQYLNNQSFAQQIDTWFQQQVKKHQVKINLTQPAEPLFNVPVGNAPYLGDKNAKVTIVEYSDFECPYCARANKTVKALIKKYGDKVKLAYKHFPLNFHPNAQKAAEASLCAQSQGKAYFWKLHDEMFADYKNLSIGLLKDKAKAIGLNLEQFSQCLSSNQFASRVQLDIDEGKALGVTATPAFFINGALINGAQPLEVFVEKIDKILAK